MKTIRFFASIRSRLAVATLVVAAAATALSCSDDETHEGYLDLGAAPDYLDYPVTGGSQTYEMYSDWNEWRILVDYDTEDQSWVDVWPDKGRGDGRFTITVGETPTTPTTAAPA